MQNVPAQDRENRLLAAIQAAHQEIAGPLSAEEIAAHLKAARQALGLTPDQLAEKAGISRNRVLRELEAAIDRERNPVLLARLARALNQEWNWLGAAAPATIQPGPGRALATARIARYKLIKDLADDSGVSEDTIKKLEHGRLDGGRRTWTDLARVLNVPLSALRSDYAISTNKTQADGEEPG